MRLLHPLMDSHYSMLERRIFCYLSVTYCTIILLRDVMTLLKGLLGKSPFKIDYHQTHADDQLAEVIEQRFISRPGHSPIVILCIGTDRSTGDALGPLVGSALADRIPNSILYGTLDDPVHAVNLADTATIIQQRHGQPYILAIDACLGQLSTVGQITFSDGPLRPGAGVHKQLPSIGDAHITGIVNVGGFMEYFVLQNTRLNIVIRMAQVIANATATTFNQTFSHDDVAIQKKTTTTTGKGSRLLDMFRSSM